jgi:hypothetical protein
MAAALAHAMGLRPGALVGSVLTGAAAMAALRNGALEG